MKIGIIQSNYLPWKGYFDLIHDADLFIFHDDLQYTKNDWRNRNKIKTPQGLAWLTIPVGTDEHRLINQVRLPADGSWAQRHWQLLTEHYRAAPYFKHCEAFFRDIYERMPWATLSELNQHLITKITKEFLGIDKLFARSEQFSLQSSKQDRVLELLHAVRATAYVSGPAAKTYINPERFAREGIELIWKDYNGYPEYPQFYPPFEHSVSIMDLLFQTGPAAADYIWGWRKAG